ncbi:MAG: class I SAM-dependent methyltransferase, partial [Tannerellaceae bacterium]|nr:class I SAM-dependent methyltransferase [Tannerellaceae bacterium]
MGKIYGTDGESSYTPPPLLSWVTPGSSVLELGSAMGYMTRYMKEELDCKVTGVEISAEMAKHAARYADQMIVGNLDTDPWDESIEGPFDYVVMGDVLEHLRNPQKTLQKAVRLLKPTGYILSSVPNISHNAVLLGLLKGEFDYQSYGLLDDTHVHFFTRKSMFELFNGCGLVCQDENSNLMRPDATELKKYYGFNLQSILLIRRPDAHVYQFVNKWGLAGGGTIVNQP